MKLVSICIPSYKPAHFRESLTSAIAQTYNNCEIIVSDDCPTDDIKSICEFYGRHLKYSRNPHPGALGRNNMNRLCRIANGEYIKFLFDDDILHPFCVEHLVGALETPSANPVTLAYSRRGIIDEYNVLRQDDGSCAQMTPTFISGADLIRKMACSVSNPVGEFTTVLFRRRDLVDDSGDAHIGEVDGELWRGLGDVATWIRLARNGDAVIHPMMLSYFRVHAASNSNPERNPEWLYAVQDWKLLLEWARRNGFLRNKDVIEACENVSRLFRGWLPKHPELQEGLNEMAELREMKQAENDRLIATQQERIQELNQVLDSYRAELNQVLDSYRTEVTQTSDLRTQLAAQQERIQELNQVLRAELVQTSDLSTQLAVARRRPGKVLRDLLTYRVLSYLSTKSPPFSAKATARFARSAQKRDPKRSLGKALDSIALAQTFPIELGPAATCATRHATADAPPP
jgi:glycosyltransferase involved in cell wall biosynthesis